MRTSQRDASRSAATARDREDGVESSSRRTLPLLIAAVLLLGVGESMAGPYLVLFGAQRAHLSPFAIGVFVTLVAVSGIAVSSLLGRQYDRAPSRRPCLLAISCSAAGYALLTTTTAYALLLTIAATLLGTGTAAFAQLFALGRGRVDGAGGLAALRGTAALRSVWSLAWAIGPLIGAAVLARYGFTGLFLATASGFALVAVPLAAAGRPRPPSARRTTGAENAPGSGSMLA
ncbi:MAG TPA: MFS transporter, partial [Actinospica sp.]|nr:MFS transporter [Actinospica sp.]